MSLHQRTEAPGPRPSPPAAPGFAPVVSVILPTKDRPVELRRAVASVLAQTWRSLELIVIDDGSAVPASVGDARGRQVTLLRHATSRGVSAARNAGIERARGRWIAFLDDDDFWHADKLELQLRHAGRHGADFIYGSSVVVDPAGRLLNRRLTKMPRDLHGELRHHNPVGEPSSVMMRAELIDRVGGFDREFSVVADWDLWFRATRVARPARLDVVTTAIVLHETNMQLTMFDGIEGELRRLHAGQDGDDPGGASTQVRQWLADRRHRSRPSLPAAVGRLGRIVRGLGAVGTARHLTRRVVHGRDAAPDWVLEQLRDSWTSAPTGERGG